MTKYQKIFGAGPRGVTLSILTLIPCFYFKEQFPQIFDSLLTRSILVGLMLLITLGIIIWGQKSLPLKTRGEKLVTTGAFTFFRHPLYGAFLSFFNVGLAIFLNNYLFVAWALVQHPIWHLNILYEEGLMREHFGEEYLIYSKKVSRFFPLKSVLR